MHEPESRPPYRLPVSPRQRRLRTFTAILLIFLLGMIALGSIHPFFHPPHHLILGAQARRAFKVQILLIGSYWTLCLLMATALILLAWLDVREVRRRLAEARRDIWRDIATRRTPPSAQ